MGLRSAFVAALCAGVAMVGVSVHGLLGVDAQLERSAFAARQQQLVGYHSVRVLERVGSGDCNAVAPKSHQRA
jgi:hypothetical protein